MQSKQSKVYNYFSPAKLQEKRQRNEEDEPDPTPKRNRVDEDSLSQLSQQSQQEVNSLLAEIDAAPDIFDDFDSFAFNNNQNNNQNNNKQNNNQNNNLQNNKQNNNQSNNQNNNKNHQNGHNQNGNQTNNLNNKNQNNNLNRTPQKGSNLKQNEKPTTPLKTPTKAQTDTEKSELLDRLDNKNNKKEDRFSFLADTRDAQRRPIGDPDYDPTTLYIPNSEYIRLTQFERQYWDIKRKFFDTVIFFKKGKFYELYETDADIGHKHLDLKMTDRVNMRMVGVPENFFAHWASKLLQLGYKVAKVDELESGLGKQMRQAKEGSKNPSQTRDVIRRELACVLTAGTLTDNSLVPSHTSHFLLVLQESSSCYGFILLDAAAGVFHLGQFSEDTRFSALETLLLQTSPKEIIYPKGLSQGALVLIRRMVTLHKTQTQSVPSEYFGTASDTLRALTIGGYFKDGELPDTFKQALESLGGIDAAVLPLEALGGCVKYLQTLKQDETILGGAEFRSYSVSPSSHLILDGATLQNLEILANNTDGGPRGSLLALLDQCTTAFGRRLFRSWLIRPLFSVSAINERLDAIEDLHRSSDLLDNLSSIFAKLPDLERNIARIKSKTCKLSEFLSCLRGFEMAWEGVQAHLTPEVLGTFSSPLLRRVCTFPDLEPCLAAMHSYFDWDDARDSGSVTPQRGLDPNLDDAIDTVNGLLEKLAAHLKEAKTIMRCNVEYKDIGKERYQIEISVDAIKRKKEGVPKEWSLMSQTKSVKRFHTPLITSMLKPLAEAEYTADVLKKEILKELQNKFNEHSQQWDEMVKCLATIDALLSLAKVSCRGGKEMCRPVFVSSADQADQSAGGNCISLMQSIHPCVTPPSGGDVVPNDIKLGDGTAAVMVITGPNMGGKSTLLRQTCITVIMAQMGCFVPAASCTMTPVDRIFTRLGARDDIVTGQSTFMVELQETGNMLNNATTSSLVILDELGRGTSTFDGYAIAYSVLAHLASNIKCRTMFSTHYHSLTEEVGRLPSVGVYHMDSIVDEEKREVAFLYRLTHGTCPRSYGLHVANMASIPQSILDEAQNIADTLHSAILHKLAKKISLTLSSNNFEQLVGLWRTAKGRWISWKESA